MKKYKEFMSEKDAMHGHHYGHGIKGKDEKNQKDAFDRNLKKYKANPDDKSAFEPTAVDKKVMKKREKGEMPKAPKSQHTEDKGPCWTGYKAVGMKKREKGEMPKAPKSQHTEDKGPCWTGYKAVGMKKKGDKMVPNCVPEETDLSEDSDKALANKAKESGEPLGDLKKVYKKGLAAYASGHRPGMTQHQWAMARVNSYIKGGPARKVDAHIRKEQAKAKLKEKAKR